MDSMSDRASADAQLGRLEALLNDNWSILQAIPLGAAGGMAAIGPARDAPTEAMQFARWAALIVLEKSV
jgi:hypothetical protein